MGKCFLCNADAKILTEQSMTSIVGCPSCGPDYRVTDQADFFFFKMGKVSADAKKAILEYLKTAENRTITAEVAERFVRLFPWEYTCPECNGGEALIRTPPGYPDPPSDQVLTCVKCGERWNLFFRKKVR